MRYALYYICILICCGMCICISLSAQFVQRLRRLSVRKRSALRARASHTISVHSNPPTEVCPEVNTMHMRTPARTHTTPSHTPRHTNSHTDTDYNTNIHSTNIQSVNLCTLVFCIYIYHIVCYAMLYSTVTSPSPKRRPKRLDSRARARVLCFCGNIRCVDGRQRQQRARASPTRQQYTDQRTPWHTNVQNTHLRLSASEATT